MTPGRRRCSPGQPEAGAEARLLQLRRGCRLLLPPTSTSLGAAAELCPMRWRSRPRRCLQAHSMRRDCSDEKGTLLQVSRSLVLALIGGHGRQAGSGRNAALLQRPPSSRWSPTSALEGVAGARVHVLARPLRVCNPGRVVSLPCPSVLTRSACRTERVRTACLLRGPGAAPARTVGPGGSELLRSSLLNYCCRRSVNRRSRSQPVP